MTGGVAYGSKDTFGVPGRVLSLSDEFFGALGRVAALGAVVELRVSDIVVLWGKNSEDAGQNMGRLARRFKEIAKSRVEAGQDVPAQLTTAIKSASAVMKERNELLHSLWPREDSGWRNRREGTLPTHFVGIADVLEVIDRLVKAIDALGWYLRSPID